MIERRTPRPRVTVRALLVAVFVVALGLAFVRAALPVLWLLRFGDGTYHGPNTDLLGKGRPVVFVADFRAAPADRVIKPTGWTGDKSTMYDWSTVAPVGNVSVAEGTRGVVEIDPAWDEDSCYPDRPIAVKITENENYGRVVAVPRRLLRRSSNP